MPVRGSKAAPSGAAVRQDRASGGAGECKTLRASTRMADEPDKIKTAASAKLAIVPLGKYFKTKAHSDKAVKQNESAGNIVDTGGILESNENTLNGDFLAEQEDGAVHKEPLQEVNSGPTPTPAHIKLPNEEAAEVVYEEDRKSEASNDSAPRDTFSQAGTQCLTQALAQDLSVVNMDQSSCTSAEATESREGSSRVWKTSLSEAGSETTTPGEDEDENSEWGKGPDQLRLPRLKKKMKKRTSCSGSPARQFASKALQWGYSSASGLGGLGSLGDSLTDTAQISLEMIHQSIMEHREETKAESRRTQLAGRKMQGSIQCVAKTCTDFVIRMGEAETCISKLEDDVAAQGEIRES
ncbi:hypothetical protein NDU88_002047 [Pleurodeles waltl]|uniref:Uncharacterized protein n=1 Tax=Pleurodeles waltl TaxID=8319 RepID=A0AAV7LHR5_PLEWA|nr:hypothetical protein NDU88_002047 [Pleurodeles waltl]